MFKDLSSTTVVFLATVSQISGHAVFHDAIGDADSNIHGYGLGFRPDVPRGGPRQIPFGLDTPVMANPPVPDRNKKVPRVYLPNTCGINLWYISNDYYSKTKRKLVNGDTFFEKETRVFIPITPEIHTLIDAEKSKKPYKAYESPGGYIKDVPGAIIGIPKATAGGYIRIMVYNTNADGTGLFKCKIDRTGGASNWDKTPLTITQNVPGSTDPLFLAPELGGAEYPLQIKLPTDLKCTGTYGGGQAKNVCMIRCENYALNGPFGGCIPFKLVDNPKKLKNKRSPVRISAEEMRKLIGEPVDPKAFAAIRNKDIPPAVKQKVDESDQVKDNIPKIDTPPPKQDAQKLRFKRE